MKRALCLLLLGLVLPATARAQFITEFNIDFGGNPPPHTPTVPFSGAILTENPYDNLFSIVVYLDTTAPTSAGILEKQIDDTFATVSPLSLVWAGYGPPYSGTAYSAERAWQLTPEEVQSLLAGAWYAQINYGDVSYLGQITPVPEPSIAALLAAGAAVTCGVRRREGSRVC